MAKRKRRIKKILPVTVAGVTPKNPLPANTQETAYTAKSEVKIIVTNADAIEDPVKFFDSEGNTILMIQPKTST